ncbi:MAG TPA: Rho termination factor N-terminal domain-containing protein [Solirubrobacterales bacterium]|jgi:hypothetical protein
MTKTELESKHLGELHSLAAEAGIERYRMLPRAELIERLADGNGAAAEPKPRGERVRTERGGERSAGERPKRQRRRRKPRSEREGGEEQRVEERDSRPKPEPSTAPATTPRATTPPPAVGRPKRKRRRRWGRRGGSKGVRVNDLLLPAAPGRQAIVYAESREACTALLRGLAAELAAASDGADPIALLIDPAPEELADWRREAPQAEIVAAGQARHADDAIAQAARRAGDGEDVIVLIDSLTRFAEAYGDGEEAKRLFDAGREATGSGTLTVVAAVERTE